MNTEIHRLLDELFAGFEMTPERQDFKEELRGNLMARVDELEAAGVPPGQAAQRAITELGDPDELLGELLAESPGGIARGGDTPGGRSGDGQGTSRLAALAALAERHRVRPKPGFVVRIVLWSILVVLGLALSVLGAVDVLSLGIGPVIGLTVGWLWAGLPALVGVAAVLLLLARMQFRAE